MSRILSKKDFGPHGFRWLTLKRITYEDPRGRTRFWESAERTSRHGDVDGVAIITLVHSKEQPLKVILESQYRPTQGNHVIELPAGLIDAGETAAQAALRELKEETGYVGTVSEVSPVCYSDPGMTNANMQFVVVEVDADAPENRNVNPELEDGEFIETFLLPYDGLYDALVAKQTETGWDIDARLLLYADAIKRTELLAGLKPSMPPAKAMAAPEGPATSSPSVADDLNCQDGLPKGLHVKTRKAADAHEQHRSSQHEVSGRQANGHDAAHPDKHELIEETHQEGFIETDPSPAVLKTEFPPELEPQLEDSLKTQQESVDGEILLENEVPPGKNGREAEKSPDMQWMRRRPDEGHSKGEGRSSIDLAAGLARSPQKARQGGDGDCDLDFNSGMFPSFRSASPTGGEASGRKDVFATPFDRQGSLITLEPMHADSGGPTGDHPASQNHSHVVYCPQRAPSGNLPEDASHTQGAQSSVENHEGGRKQASKGSPKAASAPPDVGSQGMVFGAGVALGSVAGALLTYLGAMQRH